MFTKPLRGGNREQGTEQELAPKDMGLKPLNFNVSSTSPFLTSPPTPLRHGEGSQNPNLSLLLPLPVGEGGCPGEVHRTHVKFYEKR
ncbi:hypothetical protein NSTCB13_04782 [Nostoc sp. DSM 114160]|jgi:hypothetical protein